MGTEESLHLTDVEMRKARSQIVITHAHLGENFTVTSPIDEEYNCVAWAAGDTEKNWWPSGGWWPNGFERQSSLDSFTAVFKTLGYLECEDGSLEPTFEKIVIFTRANYPTHMARQLGSGDWTSKSGTLYDISLQDLKGLEGGKIGRISTFMKRPRK